jgi:hypothetical protein
MPLATIIRILAYFMIFTCIPSDFLYAWGPLTHIAIAGEIIKLISVISTPAIEKILRFKNEFIFGNVYADVILAKNLVEYREHSHNWKNGLRVLEKAKTPQEESFAYGYLCHLASDCIAHNYYVPRYLVLSYKKLFMKHTYWEMRYDNIFHELTWKTAIKMPFFIKKPYESLIKSTLVKPLFSFSTHRNLFNGILLLQGIKQWRKAVENNSRKNGFLISNTDKKIYYESSINLIMDFLKNQDRSIAISLDPTGRVNLKKANHIRRVLLKGEFDNDRIESIAKRFIPEI